MSKLALSVGLAIEVVWATHKLLAPFHPGAIALLRVGTGLAQRAQSLKST